MRHSFWLGDQLVTVIPDAAVPPPFPLSILSLKSDLSFFGVPPKAAVLEYRIQDAPDIAASIAPTLTTGSTPKKSEAKE